MAGEPAGPAEYGIPRCDIRRVLQGALDRISGQEPGERRGTEHIATPGGVECFDAWSRNEGGADGWNSLP